MAVHSAPLLARTMAAQLVWKLVDKKARSLVEKLGLTLVAELVLKMDGS